MINEYKKFHSYSFLALLNYLYRMFSKPFGAKAQSSSVEYHWNSEMIQLVKQEPLSVTIV